MLNIEEKQDLTTNILNIEIKELIMLSSKKNKN
jgi:hypothetical protein